MSSEMIELDCKKVSKPLLIPIRKQEIRTRTEIPASSIKCDRLMCGDVQSV